MAKQFEVLIAGAGLSGLSTALALAEAGAELAIIDRFDPRRTPKARIDHRTTAISLSSRRLLTALVAWKDVAATASPILDILVSEAGQHFSMHYDHREVGDEPMGHIVDNHALKLALIDRLQQHSAVTFLDPGSISSLSTHAAEASVTTESGERYDASLIVGADGRGSSVRELAGIRISEHPYGHTSIVDTLEHELPHNNLAHERFLPGGPLALLPLSGNRSALVWTDQHAVSERLAKLPDTLFNAALMERFGDSLGAIRAVGPRRLYPLSLVLAETNVADRVALVGDAGHAIHPIAGQGFNLGLRDVAALAEVIEDAFELGLDIGSAGVLGDYQKRRGFDVMSMVAATDGLTRLFSNGIAPLQGLRSLGLGLVQRVGPLKRGAIRHAMGTLGDLPRLMQDPAQG